MTPAHRQRVWWWAKSIAMVAMFGVMLFALNRLIRAYSYDEIERALGKLSLPLVLATVGVLAVQQAFLVVREWLAIDYAKRRDVGVGRIAFASVVCRSLSTLGLSSITGVGLRLHVYEGWGLTGTDVSEVSIYDNTVFAVGVVAQIALAFTALPIPAQLSRSLGDPAVRALGVVAMLILAAYATWTQRGHELRIWKLVIPVPTSRQLLGQLLLPVIDLALTALIVFLCLPGDLGLAYADVVMICLVSSVASSITQVPAGVGVLEETVLLFVNRPDASSAVIASLFVYRLLTNLLPIVVGAIMLVILEIQRHATAPRTSKLSDATATMLALLAFVVGAIVMIVSASPAGARLGELGQVLAVGAGSGMLYVARGLQTRQRSAWRITLGLLVITAAVVFAIQPALDVIVIVGIVGGLLALSRHVFSADTHVVIEPTRWWLASAMVVAGTIWIAFVGAGRHVTPEVYAEGGAMLGVASIAIATVALGVLRRRRRRHALAMATGDG